MKWIDNLRIKSVEEKRRKALFVSIVATFTIALAWIVGENALSSVNTKLDSAEIEPLKDVAGIVAPILDSMGEVWGKILELF